MTKKHFKVIAEIIKNHRESQIPFNDPNSQGQVHACNVIGRELASFCATMNPRFDRAKFLSACGIE